ncbi:hypothetical protein Tco_0864260 [Tanacetum coccineum]
MIVMTSMIELESLFGPLFNEYFSGENQVVSKCSAVTTADASDKRQQQPYSTSSTSTLATTVSADGNFDFYKHRCCSLDHAKSNSLPHAHAQAFKFEGKGVKEHLGSVHGRVEGLVGDVLKLWCEYEGLG